VNGWIEDVEQLGDNRIIRFLIKQGKNHFRLYVRLWSNAANVVVTGEDGLVLDAMRRLPKRGEVTGGHYEPEQERFGGKPGREYEVRKFGPDRMPGDSMSQDSMSQDSMPGGASFNEAIDAYYAEHGGALSLEALREQARKSFEGRMGRLAASLERLREKERDFEAADRLREYGDIIMANLGSIKPGDSWLETDNFYTGEKIRIKLEPRKSPAAQGELYYEQYRKAKDGIADLRREIEAGEKALKTLEKTLARLLEETNPLALHRLLKNRGESAAKPSDKAAGKRPGLSFRRKDWLIMVGRDAAENDELFRRYVKGNDLWLHARDYPGSYVFIKQRAGKTVPLDILLDAGNLAIFYSKGRNSGEGDLFYTPVKFLRRAKNGPKGLVIPTQEKNLHVKVEEFRLKELEQCRYPPRD
jgi:predicted ribosome quality control (RQC) complex YloA/Tae2 family protein